MTTVVVVVVDDDVALPLKKLLVEEVVIAKTSTIAKGTLNRCLDEGSWLQFLDREHTKYAPLRPP